MPEKAMAPFVALSRSMTADIYRNPRICSRSGLLFLSSWTGFSRRRRAQVGLVAPDEGQPRGRELRASGEGVCRVHALSLSWAPPTWHERGLEVGQDTELGEDDGALRVAVDVLILLSPISQMPARGAFTRFPVGETL